MIELLIVMVVMAILAVILVPVVNKAIARSDTAKSAAFVTRVARAAEAFKGANNGRYPGQDDTGLLKGSDMPGLYTGSQVLAARLFDYPEQEIDNDKTPDTGPTATSKYLEYKSYLLIDKSSKGDHIPDKSLGDDSRTINALLYFPSRLNVTENVTDPTAYYKWLDSKEYVTQTGAEDEFEKNCIIDGRLKSPDNTRNPGGILIIGTGLNDMYLESSEDGNTNDDIKSWATK